MLRSKYCDQFKSVGWCGNLGRVSSERVAAGAEKAKATRAAKADAKTARIDAMSRYFAANKFGRLA